MKTINVTLRGDCVYRDAGVNDWVGTRGSYGGIYVSELDAGYTTYNNSIPLNNWRAAVTFTTPNLSISDKISSIVLTLEEKRDNTYISPYNSYAILCKHDAPIQLKDYIQKDSYGKDNGFISNLSGINYIAESWAMLADESTPKDIKYYKNDGRKIVYKFIPDDDSALEINTKYVIYIIRKKRNEDTKSGGWVRAVLASKKDNSIYNEYANNGISMRINYNTDVDIEIKAELDDKLLEAGKTALNGKCTYEYKINDEHKSDSTFLGVLKVPYGSSFEFVKVNQTPEQAARYRIKLPNPPVIVEVSSVPKSYRYTIELQSMKIVSYKDDDGNKILPSVSFTSEESVILDTPPYKAGYSSYWLDKYENRHDGGDVYTKFDDLTLTLKRDVNTYTLTRVFDNGCEDSIDRVSYGEKVTLDPPTKLGHSFTGWNDSSGNPLILNNDNSFTWNYTTDMTLTAQWTPIEYEITYIVSGSSNSVTETVEYGSKHEPDMSEFDSFKRYHTLEYWAINDSLATEVKWEEIATNATDNKITLYAKLGEKEAKIWRFDGKTETMQRIYPYIFTPPENTGEQIALTPKRLYLYIE